MSAHSLAAHCHLTKWIGVLSRTVLQPVLQLNYCHGLRSLKLWCAGDSPIWGGASPPNVSTCALIPGAQTSSFPAQRAITASWCGFEILDQNSCKAHQTFLDCSQDILLWDPWSQLLFRLRQSVCCDAGRNVSIIKDNLRHWSSCSYFKEAIIAKWDTDL